MALSACLGVEERLARWACAFLIALTRNEEKGSNQAASDVFLVEADQPGRGEIRRTAAITTSRAAFGSDA